MSILPYDWDIVIFERYIMDPFFFKNPYIFSNMIFIKFYCNIDNFKMIILMLNIILKFEVHP